MNPATATAGPCLVLEGVSRHFGGLKVLQDVSLEVRPGSISGLIGPNGAGKTTVFNLVTGLLAPSSGGITLNGASLVGRRPHAITRSAAGQEMAGSSWTTSRRRLRGDFQSATRLNRTSVYGWQTLLFGPARPRVTGRSPGASVTPNVGRHAASTMSRWIRDQ